MFKSSPSGMYIPSISQAVRPDVVSDVVNEDQIRLLVPSFMNYIDPKETYLSFTLQMGGVGRVQPDRHAGAHALFRNLLIRNGSNSTTIVNEEDYNASVAMLNPFTEQSSVESKHNLFEGVVENDNITADDPSNLYYGTPLSLNGSSAGNAVGDISVNGSNMERKKVAIQMRLRTKFLGDKILPVGAMGGLRFQIDTENPLRALQYLTADREGVGENGLSVGVAIPTAQLAAGWGAGDQTRQGSGNQGAYNVELAAIETNDNQKNNPFDIGDFLFVIKTTGAQEGQGELLGVITGFYKTGANKLGVEYVPQRAPATGLTNTYVAGDAPAVYVKPSERAEAHSGVFTKADGVAGAVGTGSVEGVSYTISDLEMKCLKVEPPEQYNDAIMRNAMSEGGLQMDYDTYTLYRHNQSNRTGLTTALIPAQQTRALSCLSQPLDQAKLRDVAVSSLVATPDNARNYQFVFGTHLIPTRVVPLERYSQALTSNDRRSEAIHISELQKSILNINEPVRNLHEIARHFAIGRGFSRYGQIFNLKDQTLSLRVDYDSTATQEKLFNNYIFHKRRLVINKDGVSVIV